MKFTIYQTVNLLNGKIYIGKHETDDPYDDYLGSGKILLSAIRKYGRENFKKDVLYIFESRQEMDAKEAEIINEDFVIRNDTYNIKTGGIGGWDHINRQPPTVRANLKRLQEMRDVGLYAGGGSEHWTEESRERIAKHWWGSKNKRKYSGNKNYNRMTEDEKRVRNNKISEANRSNRNNQYGTAFYIHPSEKALPDNQKKESYRYTIGEEPPGWITFIEWREGKKNKSHYVYGRHWYTDGQTNFLLKPDDAKIEINKLKRGRIIRK